MNITDVMALVNWEFNLSRADKLYVLDHYPIRAEFNPLSCEVTSLKCASIEYINDPDPINTLKEKFNEPKDEFVQVNIDDNTLKFIDDAAAKQNLTRNQFFIAAILDQLDKLKHARNS